MLDPSDVVYDPAFSEGSHAPTMRRVCQPCHDEVTASIPSGLHMSRTNSLERIFIDQGRLTVPSTPNGQTSSQLSDLAECVDYIWFLPRDSLIDDEIRCPVCNMSLSDLGPASAQEAHVKSCLEGGGGASPQTAKYLVYELPAQSALIGVECKSNSLSHSRSVIIDSFVFRCDLSRRICYG